MTKNGTWPKLDGYGYHLIESKTTFDKNTMEYQCQQHTNLYDKAQSLIMLNGSTGDWLRTTVEAGLDAGIHSERGSFWTI